MIEMITQTIPQDDFGSFSLESFQCVGLLLSEIAPGCGSILSLVVGVCMYSLYMLDRACLFSPLSLSRLRSPQEGDESLR